MSFSIAEFIDADASQPIEPVGIEIIANDALDNIAHGAPGDAHHFGNLGFVCDLCEVGGHFFEGFCETASRSRPGKHLYKNTAIWALHASWRILEDEPDLSDAKVDPSNWFVTMIVSRADLPALGTARFLPGWPYQYDERVTVKMEAFDENAGDPDQFSDKLGGAHGFLLAFSCCGKHQKAGKTVRISIFWNKSVRNKMGMCQFSQEALSLPTMNAGEPKIS